MTRAAVALAAMVLLLTLLGGATAGKATAVTPVLEYACTPAPADCYADRVGWYRSAVKLVWEWNNLLATASAGDCSDRWFTADTAGTVVYCQIKANSSLDWNARAVTIRIDKTAPTVSGGLARPPDYAGWFNHPVGFRFRGQDATSGVQSCSSGTYGGPDGTGVIVRGTCRDVAGNVAVGSFRLNYDATPPTAPKVDTTPGNHKVALKWSAPGAVVVLIVRWRAGVARKLIFSGGGSRYTDRHLKNERRYHYEVLVIDRAGNRASSSLSAVPTASKLLNPAPGARVRRPPRLVWKRVRRADYYNVQLYRRSRKVLSRWPRRAALQLRKRWRYGGKRRRLAPGRYDWYVWPGFGSRSANRYGRLLGKSHFTVVR